MIKKPRQFKAKNLKGKEVHGWFVMLHDPIFDDHCKVIGFKDIPALYNDEPAWRGNCFWQHIDIDTLEVYEEGGEE